MDRKDNVSVTVIRRLPKYHRYLGDLIEKGVERISSQEFSALIGFTASQIRQDLNNFGGFGQQGYGYNVKDLEKELSRILGLHMNYNAVVVGAGHLGQAISNYKGFEDAGFNIIALADTDPAMIGKELHGKPVVDFNELPKYMKEHDIKIGIITVPKTQAQAVSYKLIQGGATGIWNFAPTDITVPGEVVLENVRLNDSLFVLSYFLKEADAKRGQSKK
ncbi:MAG: redox-sensing transcriptional repressor Rex [Tissierellia bacterium]|nr:redox-sensing transcriptional repressor Rex [Tissierellia bacterium]